MAEFVPERTSPEPLADQVYRWMLGNITGGVWPPNLQLRAENDLAAELGVNRGTLRRALRRLADEGLLVQVHGKGTFVRGKRLEGSLAQSLLSFAEALELQGSPTRHRCLRRVWIGRRRGSPGCSASPQRNLSFTSPGFGASRAPR